MYKNQTEQEEYMINNILSHFNFEKCRKTMEFLKWKWFGEQVPSIEMLKNSAVDRLKNAIEIAKKSKCSKSTYFSSSGGLKGSAWVNRYGQIEAIKLEFVLTEWDDDGDC